ncbi:hypothetical protein JF531_01075 [Microbacterium esteraromaticum]|uniref:hypothetical protein n=1 Tax=Microbacterium esteraromaticum TaxID=57043 RepID=UPI001A8EB3FC|nr:hypothetical protein [Microbacterium esteraromaticum]MBN8423111.1 hypothetical protein [Microbacterium esteraromaticum]
MAESVRLVLNRTAEHPHVLHREDCPSIQHQVRGDLRWEAPVGGFEILETYEDGLALVGPHEGAEQTRNTALYVTLEDLPRLGRYRRCRSCSPDAPDGAPPARVTHRRVETLAASDVGRATVDGRIVRIEHTRESTTVTLENGDALTLAHGETVSFLKQQPTLQ